jgi:hypothetical protein
MALSATLFTNAKAFGEASRQARRLERPMD